ncbi:hypothetical protein RJT34_12190 [Clitoria ternatea]|uniref:Uncharacterized protein n=1 Tax=Clitoria ternatea TaxID=43366 RepID=A0AAN9JPW8_CLITE
MEVGMMEKNNEKEWELMGTKLLLQQMKEERARGDEVVEKWKQLYLAIKPELGDLIKRTFDGRACGKFLPEMQNGFQDLKLGIGYAQIQA